ncbi:ATP-dependent nuclease [Anaerocolumna aminovalerica]|uniref:ATP-dependent nuclease n=1 Tax=Anaerocolumna aminovalerica TaxID=1527 RepID=UPI000BE2B1C7|nr:AAA family ATPase [Anaerocolumna aminovalerica]
MAKAAKEEFISLISEDETKPRPRLSKLIIKNFRTIGENPVEIYLDDIVVLVGANNAGKSSILRAYEVAMNTGSKVGYLTIDDFPNNKVEAGKLPEIEVHTIIAENKPGDQWIKELGNGEMLIREKWTWNSPNSEPKRQGFDVIANDWSDKVPWGAPNVANAYRPKPHRIDAFASPEAQASEITGLMSAIIKDSLKKVTSPGNTSGKTDYEILLDQIATFQNTITNSIEDKVKTIEESINKYLDEVFKNYVIKLDAKPESNLDKTYSPFKETPELYMGPEDGFLSKVEVQGSGARRTLLWTALKYIAENGDKTSERPHVLLIDEPEMCLHPTAIRDARKVLYELPKTGNWQVMVTTHSPIFIDLSRDNTTVIRVDRNKCDEVNSTVLFRPEKAQLSEDDKENLKLLNVCDPYVHEFFFGGRIVVVEGDTEYTAFSQLKLFYPNEYEDVHIIRARGKGVIPSVVKILNQFTANYGVLHDADTEKADNGNANPAWAINTNILTEVGKSSDLSQTLLIACKQNFEDALLKKKVSKDKPYHALSQMKTDEAFKLNVKKLFDSLLDSSKEPPENCVRWSKIEELR